jgi:hypothetical protein
MSSQAGEWGRLMLKMWRRLMTIKLLALSAVGLAVIVAVVAIGFWHRRQLQTDLEGQGEHHTNHLGHDARPFTVRGERAEQDAFRGEGSYSHGEFAGGPNTD